MEIGDNIARGNFLQDPDLDSEKFKDCHTVIHLAADGMSLAIFNNAGSKVLATDNHEWPISTDSQTLINQMEGIILQSNYSFEDCLSLKFIYAGNPVSLVPQDLYEEKSGKQLLKFSSRISHKHAIETDMWSEHRAMALYAMDENLREWIRLNFSNSSVIHSSTALKNLYNFFPQKGFFAMLMVGNSYAELFLANDGKVVFYNYFTFGIEEDLLYYILFALEQNRILAPEIDLYIGGKLHKRQKLWILLEDYIGNINPMQVPEHFSLSNALNIYTIGRYINLFGGI